jgi:hypothetical protein
VPASRWAPGSRLRLAWRRSVERDASQLERLAYSGLRGPDRYDVMADAPGYASRAVARRVWPLALVAAIAMGFVAVGVLYAGGLTGSLSGAGRAGTAKHTPTGGCQLSESSSGYPDDYIRRAVPTGIHPPKPVSGWRQANRPLPFDNLFHSVFHGYLVVTYRPELASAKRATLRAWVLAHRGSRVVGSPDARKGAPLVDLVEWGWRLRCPHAVPSIAEVSRFAARRI